jgi:uncharacterized protein HemY
LTYEISKMMPIISGISTSKWNQPISLVLFLPVSIILLVILFLLFKQIKNWTKRNRISI